MPWRPSPYPTFTQFSPLTNNASVGTQPDAKAPQQPQQPQQPEQHSHAAWQALAPQQLSASEQECAAMATETWKRANSAQSELMALNLG